MSPQRWRRGSPTEASERPKTGSHGPSRSPAAPSSPGVHLRRPSTGRADRRSSIHAHAGSSPPPLRWDPSRVSRQRWRRGSPRGLSERPKIGYHGLSRSPAAPSSPGVHLRRPSTGRADRRSSIPRHAGSSPPPCGREASRVSPQRCRRGSPTEASETPQIGPRAHPAHQLHHPARQYT